MATNQAESERQAGEQLYSHLFEYLPICIFIVDLSSSPPAILEINRRGSLIYGYTPDELLGVPAACLVPEESRGAFLDTVQQVQQGQDVTIEVPNRRRDGTIFPVRLNAAPDPTAANRMIVAVEDITPEKQRRSEAEAIEAERKRIALEIHDGVAQSLAGLRFKLAQWHQLAKKSPDEIQAAQAEVQTVLTAAIIDIRRAIYALHPVDLKALGFFPALEQMVGNINERYQVEIRLELTGSQCSLPTVYELPLFRIIQESLNNIGRHAHASSGLVCLAMNASCGVAVSVRDNGRGFDPSQIGPADQPGHFGLRQMRERIQDLGGTLDIHSAIHQGTELVITLPPLANRVGHVGD